MQKINLTQIGLALTLAALSIPTLAVADQACLQMGALAYTKWYMVDSGGPGKLPAGETKDDMVRCKACHGYDHLGEDGANAATVRKSSSANSVIEGDGTLSSTNISMGLWGKRKTPITPEMIMHKGTGRAYTEGSSVWVDLTTPRTAANTAAYQKGYTLGNQHPDFSTVLTQQQAICLAEFLNSPESQPEKIFKRILPKARPVVMQLIDAADAKAGKAFYQDNCTSCHGETNEPAATSTALDSPKGDAMVTYITKSATGYTELAHKSLWGIADGRMTRKAMSNPTALDIANVLKYLESLSKAIPTMDLCGKSTSFVSSTTKGATLHIPRVTVATPTGDHDFWATLNYAPELSPSGKMVFELADANLNTGNCK